MKLFRMTALFLSSIAALSIISTPTSAYAHGIGGLEPSQSKSYINSVYPPSDDFSISIIENGERISISRNSRKTVTVLGVDSEQYIQLRADGVYLNEKSATRVINLSTSKKLNHNQTLKEFDKTSSDATTPPKWRKVSDTSHYEWHDHRAHYMGTVPRTTSKIGKSEIVVVSSSTRHNISIEFVTDHSTPSWLYISILIVLGTLVVLWATLGRRSFIHMFSPKVLACIVSLVFFLELIHVISYCTFAKQSISDELTSVLYSIIFLTCAAASIIVLLFQHKVEQSIAMSRSAPLITLTGFLGITVGTLIEYRALIDPYPASSLLPTLTRSFIVAIGLLSLIVAITGMKYIKSDPHTSMRLPSESDSIPST